MDKLTMFQRVGDYLRQTGVRRAAVFGSFARGEETQESDLDLLIEVVSGMTLFDLLRIEEELGALTNRKVDLVDYQAVKHVLRDSVFSATIPLL